MRGNPRPRVAMRLPGSGCGVSLTAPPRTAEASCWSGLHPASGRVGRRLEAGMRSLVDMRMRLTGQNGVSDYDLGFTNFLYTFETSRDERHRACRRRRPSAPRTRRLG